VKVKRNYNTALSPFTHDSQLFTFISNDVSKPTVHNTSQFRVPQLTQNVALDVDTNNGWMLIPTMDGNNIL